MRNKKRKRNKEERGPERGVGAEQVEGAGTGLAAEQLARLRAGRAGALVELGTRVKRLALHHDVTVREEEWFVCYSNLPGQRPAAAG